MRVDVALGAMEMIKDGLHPRDLAALGVSEEDLKLLTGTRCWINADKLRVRKTIDVMIFGTIDLCALDHFPIPIEYVAAVVYVFVNPCNYLIACKWMEIPYQNTEDLARDGVGQDMCDPSQLMGLLCELNSKSRE